MYTKEERFKRFSEARGKRLCFTGPKPETLQDDLGFYQARLLHQIVHAIFDDGFTTFIVGMDRGVDIMAGEIVLMLKEAGRDIHLIVALPCEGMADGWKSDWKKRYEDVIKRADYVTTIGKPEKGCFDARNKWMIDHSSGLIAVYEGLEGPSRDMISYAMTQDIDPVLILN